MDRREFLKTLVVAGAGLYVVPTYTKNELIIYTPLVLNITTTKQPKEFFVNEFGTVFWKTPEKEKLGELFSCEFKLFKSSTNKITHIHHLNDMPKGAKSVSVDEFIRLIDEHRQKKVP